MVAFFLVACTFSKKNTNQLDTYLKIEFQDGFKNDTLSMIVNDCTVFNNEILSSSWNLGVTSANVFLYKSENKFEIKFGKKSVRCILSGKIAPTFIIFVNSVKNEFQFDVEKGKYIGLNLGNMNKLDVLQLKRPFMHE